jgi:beta-galactosidase
MVRIVRRTAPDIITVIDPGYDEPIPTPGDKHAQTTYEDWTPVTPKEGGEEVEVFSNCEQVELFLNDKSLGSQSLPPNASPRKWKIPFEPGTLRAVAKNNGAVVATDQLKTAGSPTKINLASDHETLGASWDEVSYVRASVTDENGVQVPTASNLITFAISGPGEIAAVDNADNTSHESFQATQRHAYQGQCFAIIRATGAGGPITLTASSVGCASASVTLSTQPRQTAAPSVPPAGKSPL